MNSFHEFLFKIAYHGICHLGQRKDDVMFCGIYVFNNWQQLAIIVFVCVRYGSQVIGNKSLCLSYIARSTATTDVLNLRCLQVYTVFYGQCRILSNLLCRNEQKQFSLQQRWLDNILKTHIRPTPEFPFKT